MTEGPPGAAAVLAAALASALMLWLASPAVGLALVGWVALVPAAAVHLRAPASRAGRLVVPLTYVFHLELQLVPALPFGIAEDQWGDPPVPVLVGDSPVLAAALVYVPLLGALLYLLRFPQPWPAGAERHAIVAVGVPALSWAALDLLRARYDPGGLWGGLYVSQHESPTVAAAALAGPWLLTFLLVATGYALALLWVRRRRALPALAAVAAAALASAAAALSLGPAGGDPVVAAAVQPGYDTSEWELPPVRFFDPRHRDLVRASGDVIEDLAGPTRVAARGGAELVVWPEAVVWAEPAEEPGIRRALSALARGTGATIVVPRFLVDASDSAVLGVLPDGALTGPEPKQRPMWFLGEKAAGRPARPLEAPAAAVGVLLGVDNQHPGAARSLARRGATLLASATHDWRELAPQQRALARVNAASVRLPLVRADWRYGSAVLDARGRTLAGSGAERARETLLATVQARSSDAPYRRVGDLLGWAGLLVFAAGWAATRWRHA